MNPDVVNPPFMINHNYFIGLSHSIKLTLIFQVLLVVESVPVTILMLPALVDFSVSKYTGIRETMI